MHITYIYSVIIKNKGLCTGAYLGQAWCQLSQSVAAPGPPLHENLLLVLLDDLLELVIAGGHNLRQFVLYMHTMMMQHLAFMQQQLLK